MQVLGFKVSERGTLGSTMASLRSFSMGRTQNPTIKMSEANYLVQAALRSTGFLPPRLNPTRTPEERRLIKNERDRNQHQRRRDERREAEEQGVSPPCRPMGRPRKYFTEEERVQARRKYRKTHRTNLKQRILNGLQTLNAQMARENEPTEPRSS